MTPSAERAFDVPDFAPLEGVTPSAERACDVPDFPFHLTLREGGFSTCWPLPLQVLLIHDGIHDFVSTGRFRSIWVLGVKSFIGNAFPLLWIAMHCESAGG